MRVSIASVPKWSWSVICVGAGPSRITLLFPSCFTCSLSSFLSFSSFLSISLTFRIIARRLPQPLANQNGRFCSRLVSFCFVARSVRDRHSCSWSVSPILAIYIYIRTVIHSATVWSCYQWGKQKLVYKRPCLGATVLHHRRHHHRHRIVQCQQKLKRSSRRATEKKSSGIIEAEPPVPKVNKWGIEERRAASRSSSSVQLSSGA